MDRSRSFDLVAAALLAAGLAAALGPLYLALTTASHSADVLARHRVPLLPGPDLAANLRAAWMQAGLGHKLCNSLAVCILVTVAKLVLASITAFALVFFRSPLRGIGFAVIFATLLLPLEMRIAPTYALAADPLSPVRAVAHLFDARLQLHWTLLDSTLGLSLPLVATATGTFLFRQVFLTLPEELVDAAKADGAGPLRFFIDIALPLSRTNLAALAIVIFISAWNQYLWPLLITTRPEMQTAVLAIGGLLPDPQDPAPAWNVVLAGVLIVILPPLVIAALFQRGFVEGLAATVRRR
jgi:sn-glycerol 3-phosphate transport system permease protein